MDLITLLVADDHSLLRDGVVMAIGQHPEFTVVGEAASGEEAVAKALLLRPHITLMDLRMPGIDGIEAMRRIHAVWPEHRVIMLTSYSGDVRAAQALSAGAKGFLLKDSLRQDLIATLHAVHAGGRHIGRSVGSSQESIENLQGLSDREIEVLERIARGLSNKQVARELDLTEEAIKWRVKGLLAKLGARDRAHAISIALSRGVLDLPGKAPNA